MMGQQGGIHAATRAVNSAAMAYFLKFLSSKNFQFIAANDGSNNSARSNPWKEQEIFLCRQKIWKEFGTYLSDAKQVNGDLLSSGSAVNYLGQAKETVRKMYENNILWPEHT